MRKLFSARWLALLTLVAVTAFAPRSAWCFPEMVRHGYVNCTTCHVSPTGSGVLTAYGRELSREVLSTWGQEGGESQFAYALVKTPEWLNAMGEYRGAYAYQNTPYIQQGQYIYMQGDGEASATYKQWTVDATAGYENKLNDTSLVDHFISRRHYVNYRPTDELSFRAGRFYPAFGIQTPDHVIATKRDLGWDEGQETYNVEAAYIGERWNVYATADLGRPDEPGYHRETGLALSPSIAFGDTYKTGFSYFYGDGQSLRRHVIGPWGILGFTKHLYLLTEWDLQSQSFKVGDAPSQLGAVNYQKLGYEITQGFHVFVTQDFAQLDFKNLKTLHNSYGVGVQFFPRPHFEFDLAWEKMRMVQVADAYTDFAYFMLNFYL